jgi:hypothetical protein
MPHGHGDRMELLQNADNKKVIQLQTGTALRDKSEDLPTNSILNLYGFIQI